MLIVFTEFSVAIQLFDGLTREWTMHFIPNSCDQRNIALALKQPALFLYTFLIYLCTSISLPKCYFGQYVKTISIKSSTTLTAVYHYHYLHA